MAKMMASTRAQLLPEGLPEAMVSEVLLRLPLKSLYRSKCVCKTWCSIICDPEFMKLHHIRNMGIVISIVSCGPSPFSSFRSRLLQARLCLEETTYGESESPFIEQIDYENVVGTPMKFTQVINGLFCFSTPSLGLSLCNMYTNETIELPLPRLYCTGGSTSFYFGFDPISGSYKLLSLNRLSPVGAEILTIGGVDMANSSWKRVMSYVLVRLELLPQYSICIDGILYWLVHTNPQREVHVFITALYLNELKFVRIFLPMELESRLSTVETIRLMQFKGTLAVGCLANTSAKTTTTSPPWVLKLWELEDGKRSSWIKHCITLPEELVRCNSESWCSFGNLPTGEILLANPKANDSFTPVYSYDHSTGKFQRFVVGKFPCMGALKSYQISCLEVCNDDSLEALICKPPIDVVIHRFGRLLAHVI